jgi:CMP-N-acetylneuraminic acid synthetase
LPAHNYAKFLDKAIQSVLRQTIQDFELILVDDGSTDNTQEIIRVYEHDPKIRSLLLKGVGVASACNQAIAVSSGEYLVRLDADDYFDENILLVESHFLDTHPTIHMVYPDYYHVDQYGGILEHIRTPRANAEIKFLDRTPLGAGAMFRRKCYDEIGGYRDGLYYQEDYDFWLRFLERFNVHNINLPLMYYRKHNANKSEQQADLRNDARREVKQRIIETKRISMPSNVLAVIPAVASSRLGFRFALRPLAGKPVIAYAIEAAHKASVTRVVISTEDPETATVAQELGAEVPFLRPFELAQPSVSVEEVVAYLLKTLDASEGYFPDLVVVLHLLTPFRKAKHITEGIHTLILHQTDSVIGVCQDVSFYWKQGVKGLEPVGSRHRLLRAEREAIFKENGALYVVRAENVRKGRFFGEHVGYVEMTRAESLRLESEYDFWIAEQILLHGNSQ